MAITPRQALRMHLLLSTRDSTKDTLVKEFPNIAYVVANPTAPAPPPGEENQPGIYGRNLFAKIDPDVYAGYHQKLKALNDGQATVPGDISANEKLKRAYKSFSGFTDLADNIFPAGLWKEGQHPDAGEQGIWQNSLEEA